MRNQAKNIVQVQQGKFKVTPEEFKALQAYGHSVGNWQGVLKNIKNWLKK